MIDMKISEQEKKEDSSKSVLEEKPSYPYGLRIYLDPESVKKLGLSGCQVGEKLMIEGMCEVVSVNSEVVKGDEKMISIGMQIQEVEFEKESGKSAESVIYG